MEELYTKQILCYEKKALQFVLVSWSSLYVYFFFNTISDSPNFHLKKVVQLFLKGIMQKLNYLQISWIAGMAQTK